MTTIITHAAVPLVLGLCLGRPTVSSRLLLAGMLAAMLPDADVIAFKLHIAYQDNFGHRGASHSLSFAVLIGLLAACFCKALHSTRSISFCFIGFACLSHGLLDMLTNGGEGVALFWPLYDARLFFPWQVIEVSPIAMRHIFSHRVLVVLLSELLWVWLPLACIGLLCYLLQAAKKANADQPRL